MCVMSGWRVAGGRQASMTRAARRSPRRDRRATSTFASRGAATVVRADRNIT